MMQPCPRMSESPFKTHDSHWREDGTCSYCGSISPAMLFESIEAGHELGPTDKNYKVYVTRPDPKAGQPRIVSVSTHEVEGYTLVTPDNLASFPSSDGWSEIVGRWVQVRPTSATRDYKFYFQHLTQEERVRFVGLLNDKKIKIGYPGRFYNLPFFVSRGANA